MTITDAHVDVAAEPSTRHGWWAVFFIILALLVIALSASAFNDARILAIGASVTFLSIGLVFLGAELRRPPSSR